MKRSTGLARTLTASAALAVAVALSGCQTDDLAQNNRAMQPLSREMQARLDKKNMPVESSILVRVFKEESELEVWKRDASGQFALLKTYPICRWSGDLGPKVKQGDRQAPEGFYTITPGQMNPKSQYYLAFNLGFPNAFDKAHGRTGAFLMVHGDCSSSGCYSMSDEQMAEIYALGREAFLGGQKSFQVQAFPFRMTPSNMAKHRANPHFAFWRMIKEGNDHFEVTKAEPKVDVCNGRYVFNATPVSGSFNPSAPCPSYRAPPEIVAAVKEKQEQDERQFAALVAKGAPTAAVGSGSDGGMHPSFVAKLQPQTVIDTTGRPAAYTKPGSGLPELVRLPRALESDTTSGLGKPRLTQVASADSSEPVAVAQPSEPSSGNFFSRLFSGGQPASEPAKKESPKKDSADAAKSKAQTKPSAAPAVAGKPAPTAAPAVARTTVAPVQTAAKPDAGKSEPKRQLAQSGASGKPASSETALPDNASAYSGGGASGGGSPIITGAQPVLSTTSFEGRWGGMR